jgi:NADPH:quinone reductase-like Zn-dependent oxidoreductase
MAATTTTAIGDPVTAIDHDPARRMSAIVHSEYGSTDVLRLTEIDRPQVAADEVLVEVRAAGLDRGVWHLMTGMPYALRFAGFGVRAPKQPVLGGDLAGVVVAVGDEVTRFQPGDEVFGIGKGSFAEYTVAPESKLALKPANLTFEQAAAIPVSAGTALQGLSDVGRLEPGQRVLIIGASGGVGSFAVQIARALGADVTGVCSTGKIDLVRSLGADHVIDYTRDDFADGETNYDLILDVGGSSSLSRLRRALTPRGTLVITGGEDGGRWLGVRRQLRAVVLSLFIRQRLTTFIAKEDRASLDRLAELVVDGRLVPAIERTYPLADVPTAIRHLEAGRARGKLVITI